MAYHPLDDFPSGFSDGRGNDTVRENVISPFFCGKKGIGECFFLLPSCKPRVNIQCQMPMPKSVDPDFAFHVLIYQA